ncbi:hypothetical protein EV212_10223 [Frisingicoccus caecimuris]|uniref:Uncharacterized protein n=1 Tax=Frisingicoccus caecimuris TaxID=1796636 RepID=A0A4R2LE49_9FIRM|nr:hypothetical protein EV212_10223 [Frisingicoccus caecimuris]
MEELFRVYFTYGILGCGIIIVYTIYRIKDIYSSKNTSIYLNVKYPIWHRYIIGFMVLIVTTLIIMLMCDKVTNKDFDRQPPTIP